MCWVTDKEYGLDRSGGVDSEGEVDVWLINVSRQWCEQYGWLSTRARGHDIRSRIGVVY